MPAPLTKNIAAYDAMRRNLELDYFGKWVVFYDEEFVGNYDEFEDAAQVAIERYGRGPYLIRQVGASPMRLPSSLLYQRIYAND